MSGRRTTTSPERSAITGGPPTPRGMGSAGADGVLLRQRPPHRRGVGVADRHRQRVGRVVGARQLVERKQRLDHALHFVLAARPEPQTASNT